MLAVCIIRNDGRDEMIMNPDSFAKRDHGNDWYIEVQKGTETYRVRTGEYPEGKEVASNLFEEWVNAIAAGDKVIEVDEAYLPIAKE